MASIDVDPELEHFGFELAIIANPDRRMDKATGQHEDREVLESISRMILPWVRKKSFPD